LPGNDESAGALSYHRLSRITMAIADLVFSTAMGACARLNVVKERSTTASLMPMTSIVPLPVAVQPNALAAASSLRN